MKSSEKEPHKLMDYRRRRPDPAPDKGAPRGLKVYMWACALAVLLFFVARSLGAAPLV